MKVTCLCLTKDRPHFLTQALNNYARQTHLPRELIVVADKAADVAGLEEQLEQANARVLFTGPLKVGTKRNLGVAISHGDVIAHWDDDDYSAPKRLEDQVARLIETQQPVTGYTSMKFTDGHGWWLYRGSQSMLIGTSLMYTRSWWDEHPFSDVMVGEDNQFVSQALPHLSPKSRPALSRIAPAGDLGMMYARVHPGNVSPKPVHNAHTYQPLPNFVWSDPA